MPLFGLATMAASTPMLSAVLLFFVPVITGGSGSVGASTALDDVCGGMGGYYVTRGAELGVLCPDPDPSSRCHAARARRPRGQARGGQRHRSQRQARGRAVVGAREGR
jgi:hypothetical protein